MKIQLKKFAVLKTISSKIGAYLHKIDAVPQEDDSDFDDDEWTILQNQLLSPSPLDLLLSLYIPSSISRNNHHAVNFLVTSRIHTSIPMYAFLVHYTSAK